MSNSTKNTGLIHIYTGDGKGKTSACAGMAIRAAGHGLKVFFVQFQKGIDSGELNILRKTENINVKRICSFTKFLYYMDQTEKEAYKKEHIEAFVDIVSFFEKNPATYDVLILDEIIGAVNSDIISQSMLIDFLNKKPEKLEIVLSGRNASNELIELADYVSDIACIKHPYEKHTGARKGIEF